MCLGGRIESTLLLTGKTLLSVCKLLLCKTTVGILGLMDLAINRLWGFRAMVLDLLIMENAILTDLIKPPHAKCTSALRTDFASWKREKQEKIFPAA